MNETLVYPPVNIHENEDIIALILGTGCLFLSLVLNNIQDEYGKSWQADMPIVFRFME